MSSSSSSPTCRASCSAKDGTGGGRQPGGGWRGRSRSSSSIAGKEDSQEKRDSVSQDRSRTAASASTTIAILMIHSGFASMVCLSLRDDEVAVAPSRSKICAFCIKLPVKLAPHPASVALPKYSIHELRPNVFPTNVP